MIPAVLAFALTSGSVQDCRIARPEMLQLDRDAFDQGAGGWRRLEAAQCHAEAADIIRDWRALHTDETVILRWHEGQERAKAGQRDAAIALFLQAYRTVGQEPIAPAWNLYVSASIAFLQGDRMQFDRARAALAVLPRPADWDESPGSWPANLGAVDALGRCWGQPYRIAYSCRVG